MRVGEMLGRRVRVVVDEEVRGLSDLRNESWRVRVRKLACQLGVNWAEGCCC